MTTLTSFELRPSKHRFMLHPDPESVPAPQGLMGSLCKRLGSEPGELGVVYGLAPADDGVSVCFGSAVVTPAYGPRMFYYEPGELLGTFEVPRGMGRWLKLLSSARGQWGRECGELVHVGAGKFMLSVMNQHTARQLPLEFSLADTAAARTLGEGAWFRLSGIMMGALGAAHLKRLEVFEFGAVAVFEHKEQGQVVVTAPHESYSGEPKIYKHFEALGAEPTCAVAAGELVAALDGMGLEETPWVTARMVVSGEVLALRANEGCSAGQVSASGSLPAVSVWPCVLLDAVKLLGVGKLSLLAGRGSAGLVVVSDAPVRTLVDAR